ncbi:unnamed protein product [Phaedon cochleariae]|uniref:Amidase domain-containing protein n=1 Tax=Phaedon cochleariae TaxID=80249 RepID=A0A9N9S732_PHACE|nr:unnamed protein product [Phaedon cochleariae]
MAKIQENKQNGITGKESTSNKMNCGRVKALLVNIFLFLRYYVDILIDNIFGFFNDSKRKPIKNNSNPILHKSATSLARKIRKGELKSEEVVQAYIDRIKEVNPVLNSLVDSRYDDALKEARRIDEEIASGCITEADFQRKPFLGLPFTTKESTAVKGLSFSFGILKRKGRKASYDADYVKLMKNSGAICLGVTNIPQLNLWQETHNPLFGITNNPYNTTRNVGGSCGGEASLLAAGGTPLSIGTDVGGSTRIPAFMCGVFGHKPTSGLISTKGIIFQNGNEEESMVNAGPLTKYSEDLMSVLKVLVGPENSMKLKLDQHVDVKKIKICYVSDPRDLFVSPFRPEMKKIFSRAIDHFKEIHDESPESVEFEGTKYTGQLWKYWMTQEDGFNFRKDVTDRQGEVNPVIETLKYFTTRDNYTFSTIMNLINELLPTANGDWARSETEKLKHEILHSEISGRKPTTKKMNCEKVKAVLLSIFLFLRYYFDLLIDYIFGYFNDKKRTPIKNNSNPILHKSATSLAQKIRKGELKSEEVVQAYIDRIKEVNPILNALVDSRYEDALQEAKQIDKEIESGIITDSDFQQKPFLGVPFTTKESSAVKGLSFTFGIFRRKGKKASFDADYVALMKNAGAICLGVTNIPQLNLWQETHNPLFGITNNPYNTTRNVGGSSGGEASLLAAGGTPISVGTDIGGSVRIPAFMCGVFGHKPTSGLIPTKGITFRLGNEGETMVNTGPLTKYADDLISVLKVLVGPENTKKLKLDQSVDVETIKIKYILDPKDLFVSPFRTEMKTILARAINHLRETVNDNPESVEFEGTKYTVKLWKYWMTQESGANFYRDITDRQEEVNPYIETIKHFTVGGDYTLSTIINFLNNLLPNPKGDWARSETEKLRNEMLEKLGENGVLLFPSAPFPASYHHAAYLRPWNFNLFSLWNVLKFPVTQVPMGLSESGLPLGIQVVAAPYQDRLCFAVAKELERAFGGYVPPYQTE